MMLTTEPDYTITIDKTNTGWVVCEGSIEISRVFESEDEAKWWAHYHALFCQPLCCVCGSAITRPDDPWEVYSTSLSSGHDWMHLSCMKKFDPNAWVYLTAKKT